MSGDPVPEPSADALLGKVLDGRYRIESVLGQGGMGMVFRAVQTSMQRPVAVKTLHPQLAIAPTFFERFRREAELASRLKHPNIITIFDFGRTAEGQCYYVMELIDGESLRQRVRREGPMSLRRAAAVLEQVALGVGHAHKQGVVHRDLKPHNIMLSQVDGAEYLKVLDFGLVKALEGEDDEHLTSTGQVLGTPQYMPPEQAGGEAVDVRSDIYSLTGVFYFCLTGTSPFQAKTVRKALSAALTQTVAPVATHRRGAGVPRAIDELMRKGLAREKEDRYQSCDALLAELAQSLAEVPDSVLDALPAFSGEGQPGAREGSGESQGSPGSKSARRGSSSAAGSRGPSSKVQVASGVSRPLPPAGEARRPEPVAQGRETAPNLPRVETPPPRLAAPTPPSAARRGANAAVVLLAVGLLAALAGTAAWWALAHTEPQAAAAPMREPAAPPRPAVAKVPAAVAEVTVELATVPAGAEVFEDGVLVGKTPISRQWPADAVRTVGFKLSGFVALERAYRLQHSEHFEVQLEPATKRPAPVARPGPRVPAPAENIPAFE